MGSIIVGLNGFEVWGFVVEQADGVQVRLALDDWLKLNLGEGQRVPVRLPERRDVWLYLTHVTELPPIVWITLARQVHGAVAARASRRERGPARQEPAIPDRTA
jgi:hypothetical protein